MKSRPCATARRPRRSTRGETHVRELVRALVLERDLNDAAYAAASARLGTPQLIELIALVGYYDLLALSLRVFRTPLPAGVPPPFEEA